MILIVNEIIIIRRIFNVINVLFVRAQLNYLNLAAESAQPSSEQQMKLLKPTSDKIQAVQNLREKNRASPYFNHLSAISESIPALGWVAVVSI